MRLFFCSFESIFDHIFESQILLFITEINKKLIYEKKEIFLVNFGSITDIFKKDYWKKRKLISGSLKNKVFFAFKFPYMYRFPSLLRLATLINSLNCLFIFLFFLRLKKSQTSVFHCRTEMGSNIILRMRSVFFKNIKIICDCRGLGSKEILYKIDSAKNKILSEKIGNIEKFVHSNADYLFCVSKAFKMYIQGSINSSTENIEVIPCCVDTNKFNYDPKARIEIRRELGVSDNFVFLYSGSFNKWQLIPQMIRLFKILKQFMVNSFFVVYTMDLQYAKMIFSVENIDKNNVILKSIPPSLINKYLLAGDIGFLIREDNLVNNIAFPVKFAEYVSCGVPVLSSIKSDVIDLIEKYDLGFKLKNYDDESEIRSIAERIKCNQLQLQSEEYKSRISRTIREKLSWDNYTDKIISIYKNLHP